MIVLFLAKSINSHVQEALQCAANGRISVTTEQSDPMSGDNSVCVDQSCAVVLAMRAVSDSGQDSDFEDHRCPWWHTECVRLAHHKVWEQNEGVGQNLLANLVGAVHLSLRVVILDDQMGSALLRMLLAMQGVCAHRRSLPDRENNFYRDRNPITVW